MGLQINLTDTNLGIPCPEAYARITGALFDANTAMLELQVAFFTSQAARESGKTPFDRRMYRGRVGYAPGQIDIDVELDAGFRAAVYAWLKTLPDFAGAIDVIDAMPPTGVLDTLQLSLTEGTVTLTSIAPRGGLEISLTSDNAAYEVPGTVTVVGGLTSATFPVVVTPGEAIIPISVTAVHGEISKTTHLHIPGTVPAP